MTRRSRAPTRIVTEGGQAISFTRRATLLGGLQTTAGVMLIGRMSWLAIAENEHYRTLAESNRVQLTIIPPRRGWIVDRAGRPIAINRSDFRVDLIPDRLHDPDRIIAELQRLLGLSPEDVARVREDLAKAAGYQPVPVAEKLDYERFAAVSVRLPELPGVAPTRSFARYYPAGAAVGHLTGYVGTASAADYEREHDPLLITPGFKIGKEGLERTMETRLRGKPGAKRTEITARGRLVRELTTRPDSAGGTLHLTIDAQLQEYAARRMGDNSGSAVVIDCLSGEMLAMVSMPAYDPNSFSDGIGHDEWAMLSGNDHLPLLNKTLQGLYPPGSTIKPMTALAALEAGVSPDQQVFCSGAYRVGNALFHCWKRHGHGAVSLERAIAQSCDVYFYTMGRQIGIDRIAGMARRLGLGDEFSLPVASQRYGTVPDTAWKQRKYKADWTVADTVNASIGQGYMLVNPLQLAVMAARIASGRALVPSLLQGRAAHASVLDIAPGHLELVRQAMGAVVTAGTAGGARMQVPGVQMAGKTGSAQVRRITMAERAGGVRNDASLPWRFRDHALFVCFAPVENPRYAAAVIVEHGSHGASAAAPVARDMLTFLYDRPRAMATLATFETAWGGDIAARMARDAAAWRAAKAAAAAPPVVPPATSDGAASIGDASGDTADNAAEPLE